MRKHIQTLSMSPQLMLKPKPDKVITEKKIMKQLSFMNRDTKILNKI